MKNYLKNRDRAMDWLNSEKQDFAQGIAILKDAGFKPGVVGVLERHGSGRNQSDERLVYHIREFIRCYADPKAKEDTDISLGVVKGEELSPDPHDNSKKIPSMMSDGVEKKVNDGAYPEVIAGIIKVYRTAYVSRDKFLRILADLPETNDDATILKRRKISDAMKDLSDVMDKLYPQYAAYVNEGKVPEQFKEPTLPDPEAIAKETTSAAATAPAVGATGDDSSDDSSDGGIDEPFIEVTKADLQKERKSIVTKISRARNMLLYQKETKQEQENPLTDPKKVAKYQAKIDRLTEELHDIDMQIAELA